MEFKDRLKNLRQTRGLSQDALAKAIYVSRSAIAKWENGLGIPSDSNLEGLCQYFQVEEGWLLDRNDLKKQVKDMKEQTPSIIAALFVAIIPFIYVLLGLTLTFTVREYISTYYPPISLFDFIVNHSNSLNAQVLLWFTVAIWTVAVAFAVVSITVGKLKRHTRICFGINLGLIVLSLSMFLTVLFVTIGIEHPKYIF